MAGTSPTFPIDKSAPPAPRVTCDASTNSSPTLRQINPTGKSLLIFRNTVNPENQKYSASLKTQIRRSMLPVYRDKRGDRDRHDRAVGCDGR